MMLLVFKIIAIVTAAFIMFSIGFGCGWQSGFRRATVDDDEQPGGVASLLLAIPGLLYAGIGFAMIAGLLVAIDSCTLKLLPFNK